MLSCIWPAPISGYCEHALGTFTPALIVSLVEKTTTFGSVAVSIILGFAASAVVFGAYFHAFKILEASLYLRSHRGGSKSGATAEVSRDYELARSMTIMTPFVFESQETQQP